MVWSLLQWLGQREESVFLHVAVSRFAAYPSCRSCQPGRSCLVYSPAVFSHAVMIYRPRSRGCFVPGSPFPSPHSAASTSAFVKWFWWRIRDGRRDRDIDVLRTDSRLLSKLSLTCQAINEQSTLLHSSDLSKCEQNIQFRVGRSRFPANSACLLHNFCLSPCLCTARHSTCSTPARSKPCN